MDQISVRSPSVIDHPKGDILHGLRLSQNKSFNFGELYFSKINYNEVKGWKKHLRMNSNLFVPVGKVRFVFFDGHNFSEHIIGEGNYQSLSVGPGLWMAFQGMSQTENLVVNLADLEHDPEEAENKALEEFQYNWSL